MMNLLNDEISTMLNKKLRVKVETAKKFQV